MSTSRMRWRFWWTPTIWRIIRDTSAWCKLLKRYKVTGLSIKSLSSLQELCKELHCSGHGLDSSTVRYRSISLTSWQLRCSRACRCLSRYQSSTSWCLKLILAKKSISPKTIPSQRTTLCFPSLTQSGWSDSSTWTRKTTKLVKSCSTRSCWKSPPRLLEELSRLVRQLLFLRTSFSSQSRHTWPLKRTYLIWRLEVWKTVSNAYHPLSCTLSSLFRRR